MAEDFWPEIETRDIVTPASILREQAGLLGPKTMNLVTAEVIAERQERTFAYRLFLVAPALANYTYLVLRMEHDIRMYPAIVTDYIHESKREVADQDEYVGLLAAILSSAEVKTVVESLIAQSAALADDV